MANHCYNQINFYGEPSVIKELEAAFNTYSDYDYFTDWVNSVINLEPDVDKKDYTGYGTKWFDFELDPQCETALLVHGDSAWAPPLGMTEAFCKYFKIKATHDYEEPGMDFAGTYTFDDKGVVSKNELTYNEYRYQEDPSSHFENILEDIPHYKEYESLEDMMDTHHYLSEEHKLELIKEYNHGT